MGDNLARPRGSKNRTTNTTENKQQEQIEEFDFQEFARSAASNLSGVNAKAYLDLITTGLYNNPLWRNEILKELTSTPVKYKRDDVLNFIENPVHHEKALKDLAQYLMNNSMHFKRIVHYFANMLDFRYFYRPVGVTAQDVKTKAYEKARQKALAWFDKFNIKHEFGNAMQTLILEDAGFYYVRENKGKVTLQRMPSDYCKIVDKTDLGYQYAFNMVYFFRPGVTLEAFAPEFSEWYDEFTNSVGDPKSSPYFWKDLPPEKAWVFKWDENFAGIIPVLIGLYLDTIEIDEFKQLLKTKTVLENWKILFQKIPMKTGDKANKNDFLIDATTAGKFQSNIKQALPSGTSVITSPMEVSAVNFEQAESRNNIVGYAESAFHTSAGTSPILFGGQSNSSAGLNLGITVDGTFVTRMYHQFARFINFHLNETTGKYKFKVVFPNGTVYSQQQDFDNALKMAEYGFPKTLVACHAGLEPNDLEQLMLMEEGLGLVDKLIPLQSAHTSSNDGGRPNKDSSQLEASTINGQDNGGNDPDKRT